MSHADNGTETGNRFILQLITSLSRIFNFTHTLCVSTFSVPSINSPTQVGRSPGCKRHRRLGPCMQSGARPAGPRGGGPRQPRSVSSQGHGHSPARWRAGRLTGTSEGRRSPSLWPYGSAAPALGSTFPSPLLPPQLVPSAHPRSPRPALQRTVLRLWNQTCLQVTPDLIREKAPARLVPRQDVPPPYVDTSDGPLRSAT